MFDYKSWYIIAAPLYLAFLIFSIWKKRRLKYIILHSLVFAYIVAVVGIVIFPLPFQARLIEDSRLNSNLVNNFVPLRSIIDIFSLHSLSVSIKQIGGNIFLLLPWGFFVPLVWFKKARFIPLFKIGILSALSIELMQFLISLFLGFTYKVTDVDDIILNTFGFIIGYFLFWIFQQGKYAKEEFIGQ